MISIIIIISSSSGSTIIVIIIIIIMIMFVVVRRAAGARRAGGYPQGGRQARDVRNVSGRASWLTQPVSRTPTEENICLSDSAVTLKGCLYLGAGGPVTA